MKRLLQITLMAALLPAVSPAQWQGPAVSTAIMIAGQLLFLHGAQVVQECHNGQLWNVTYRTYVGAGTVNVVEQTEGPLGPCKCQAGGSQSESNCTSGDTNGNQQTVPGQAASVSLGGFGGSGGSGEGLNQSLPRNPSGLPTPFGASSIGPAIASRLPALRGQSSHAVTPASAFTYTLPFRNLPFGPLPAEATSPTAWSCNAALNPTMYRVYHVDNVVDRYNLCTGAIVASINVPQLPLQIRVTPDGAQAIVTSYAGAITFIDTTTNTVSSSITSSFDQTFTPSGVAISPNGQYALVTNYEPPPYAYVSVIDMTSKTIKSKISLDTEYPESIFINPDATLAWITYPWDNVVEVLDILSGTVIQKLTLNNPYSIAFTLTGTKAFVSDGGGSVNVLDTSTYQMIKSIPAGGGATDLQITPDGAYVFVNNSTAGSVTLIDTQALTAVTTNLAGRPQGSVVVPAQ